MGAAGIDANTRVVAYDDQAGAVVTDAYGRSLAPNPLLGSGHEFQMSVVASANLALHEAILGALDAGFSRVSG